MGEPPAGTEAQPPTIVAARPVEPIRYPPRLDLRPLTRREAGLDLLLLVLVALLVPFGTQVALVLIAGEETLDVPPVAMLIAGKWFDVVLVVALAVYFVCRHRVSAAGFGLRTDQMGLQALWGMATVTAVYAAMLPVIIAISAAVLAYPPLQEDLAHRTEFLELIPLDHLGITVLLLIPVAIHEELLFRGLLIPYLRRVGLGWTWAILISGAVFALLHVTQGWLGVVQIFVVGIVLGTFFVLSRSVTAMILAHFLFDLLQTQLARYLMPVMEKLSEGA